MTFQWKTVRQDQTWLKEESSSLLVLVGMDDGAGVSAEGGPLAGFCHAFYITSTNSGFYITLSLWDWWWWWWGMIMLMLRRRGSQTGPCQAFYIASTNSGFYITLSLWGWWWWWQGMIMLMLRRRGPLVLARRFTSPFPPTLHRINLPHTFSTLKKWFQPDEDERN